MNRRNLLKGLLGVGIAGAAGAAASDEKSFYGPGIDQMGLAPLKTEGGKLPYDQLEDRYWEAQQHIDSLYV